MIGICSMDLQPHELKKLLANKNLIIYNKVYTQQNIAKIEHEIICINNKIL